MNILYFIIPLAILLALFFVALFFWAASAGQYDDLETPAYKLLIDDITTKEGSHGDKK